MRETDAFIFEGFPPNTASFNNALNGWAAGGGIEARLAGNWSVKLEYLHLDLGGFTNNNGSFPQQCAPAVGGGLACVGPFTLATTSTIRDDIIRVGVNYKIAAAGGAAMPAALPVHAAAPVSTWNGFYVGTNGGYGVGSDPFSQLVTVTGVPSTSTFTYANVALRGGLFGGQAGYNWQMGQFVIGLEAYDQWTSQHGASCGIDCTTFITTLFYTPVDQKLDWLATARGRFGWANDGYLLYVTGGGAWGGIKETDSIGAPATTASFNQTRGGWTAGAGIEAKLWGNWSGKVEYLHFDLGNTTNAFPVVPTVVLTTTSAIRDDVVRVGLNYKLGG